MLEPGQVLAAEARNVNVNRPELHSGPPRWFGTRQAVISFASSQLLQGIWLLMMLGVVAWAGANNGFRIGWVWLASLMMLGVLFAGMLYLLPFLAGNDYITGLVRRNTRYADHAPNATICQVALVPRKSRGLRAFVDDADDVGVLTWSETHLEFRGASIHFSIPFTHLRVKTENVGWRGLWLIGQKARVTVWGFSECEAVVLMDRTGSTTPAARRATRRLVAVLQERATRAADLRDPQFNVELPEPGDGTAPQHTAPSQRRAIEV